MRMIARLDIKNEYVIKGIHLEGLRKVGLPQILAKKYYEQGIHEFIFMDAVASLYNRNNLFAVIKEACQEIFVPMTLGGGIRSLQDIEQALQAGADKIAINTAAITHPNLIEQAAKVYGSQCVVASIEAKYRAENSWEAYIDNGREPTGKDVIEWAKELVSLGAGEILLTSIDKEGTRSGFDLALISAVTDAVTVPVVASGGMGKKEHLQQLAAIPHLSGVAFASVLHYEQYQVRDLIHDYEVVCDV